MLETSRLRIDTWDAFCLVSDNEACLGYTHTHTPGVQVPGRYYLNSESAPDSEWQQNHPVYLKLVLRILVSWLIIVNNLMRAWTHRKESHSLLDTNSSNMTLYSDGSNTTPPKGLFGSFSWSDVRFWDRDVYVFRL